MTSRQLVERGAILEGVTASGTVPIRIIAEGKGSTATYTREFLQSNASVFANRAMYISHPDDLQNPAKRSVANIAARTGKIVEYKVVDGVAGLYTNAKPRAEFKELIEEYGDLFGVSIYTPDSTGTESSEGEYLVESVPDSPLISVDFVSAAGAGGRIEALIESLAAVEQSHKPSATSAQENKDNEIMEEKLDKLINLVESFVTSNTAQAGVEAQAKVDAEALAESSKKAVESYDAAVVLIEAASELLPSQRASLRAAAKTGADVAPLIEAEKTKIEEFKQHSLTEDASGRSFGAPVVEDWTVAGVTV